MTVQREPFSDQKSRILSTIDKAAKTYCKRYGIEDNWVTLNIAKIMSRSNANKTTFYSTGYQWQLDSYNGCKYMKNKGKIAIKPETWLKFRDQLEEVKNEVDN